MKGSGMLRCSRAWEGVDMGPVSTHLDNPLPADGSSPLGPGHFFAWQVLLKGELAVPFLGGLYLLMLV